MAQGYAKSTATIAPATATRLSAILAAEGYTGGMIGKYLQIQPGGLVTLSLGFDSSVTVANGINIPSLTSAMWERTAPSPELAIDPGMVWLISTAGGDFVLSFEPF
jgi:hypothetical protein